MGEPKQVGEIDYATKEGEIVTFQCGDGSKPVGVCHLNKENGCIFSLVVLEEYQGNGLGESLVKKAEDFAKQIGLKSVFSQITEKNEKSKSLFLKCGYEKNGESNINDYGLSLDSYIKNI